MRKERFTAHRRTKLPPRGDGPFQILEKINDNAYKMDLPGEYKVFATFNISDLSPFDVGEDLRSNPFEERGNDGNQGGPNLKDPSQVPDGPITRSDILQVPDGPITRSDILQVPDGPITRSDILQVPDGPTTRSRAKKIKEAMQGLVQ
jgi:hypothetical protein